MKFLLFFVSIVFSYIFYIFYNLTKWKNYFWSIAQNPVNFDSLSWNLLIESFLFLLIWIFFLFLFSSFKPNIKQNKWIYKNEILYFVYYIFFIFYIYFFNKWFESITIIILLFFVLSDVLFNHISNIKIYSNYKIKLRYIWLILNYISTIFSFYHIFNNWLNIILIFILIFNLYFNLVVHKKYINYISFLISITIILVFIYSIYMYIIKLLI